MGAKVNLQDNDGQTALMEAANYGYLDIVYALLTYGANIDLQNNDGKTAIDLADDDFVKQVLMVAVATKELQKIESGFSKSHWKNKDGGFNTARLASDSIAGVVLGTAGGLITSSIIKKNQTKSGFENMNCTINGQNVASYGDEFVVGVQ